ncbi:hypothetical protein BAUCODRAFT_107977 [Baudoinia panamericana UAMH 10762]|uniref:Ketoreductase (KR) domain-containing protein n=1 Tax=Baudoinia panamericana (strain UAMH 10762) TaxID=717646 RepID=M2LPP9_BAUPA|nr:uncharacterized protein BAUCODRAFT_107977 [Baudoinia panamericana UAMH 10762]EMC96382.1 hypothetical protein BAUCODRAFT_107977 [Baudoinia panamericana UAMH 10762]
MATVPDWGEKTSGSEVAERFQGSIRGRNVLITGVSPNSLGESTAAAIARHEPNSLVLASRTKAKLDEVANSITQYAPRVRVHCIELDLSSQASVRKAAVQIASTVDHLDVLINNAAVVTSERKETAEGIELQFGTNHIGHHLLTSLLMPLIIAGANQPREPSMARIVNVTSQGYRLSPIRFHDYNFQGSEVPPEEQPAEWIPAHMKPDPASGKPYYVFTAYGQSKTANILHTVSLNKKYGGEGIRAFAVHPGSIWTDLSRNLAPDDLKIIEGTSTFWKNQDQGVATTLVAAFDPKLAGVTDRVYLSDCQLEDVVDHAKDPALAERLWLLSEQLTAGDGQYS